MIKSGRSLTLRITQLAMMSAIIVLMTFTPLGYFRSGPLSITLLAIPVVLGAMILGPWEGAILGAVFGLTSFAQCFGIDIFGTTLLGINPLLTFILCLVPRILIGLLSGHLFKWLEKLRVNQTVSFALASLAGSLTNTVFFVGMLILFFGNSEYIRSFGDSIPKIIAVLVTINTLVEAVAVTVVGTILAKAIAVIMKKRRVSKD